MQPIFDAWLAKTCLTFNLNIFDQIKLGTQIIFVFDQPKLDAPHEKRLFFFWFDQSKLLISQKPHLDNPLYKHRNLLGFPERRKKRECLIIKKEITKLRWWNRWKRLKGLKIVFLEKKNLAEIWGTTQLIALLYFTHISLFGFVK